MPCANHRSGTASIKPGTMMDFSPFKNESDAITIGNLKIENREDRIAIYGTLALTRDRPGLAAAKELQDLVVKIIKELESEHDLPLQIAQAEATVKVKNPFG